MRVLLIFLVAVLAACAPMESTAQPTIWGPTPNTTAPSSAGRWGVDPVAAAVEQLVRDNFMLGNQPFTSYTCRTDACWVPYINGFSFKNGILKVTVQVDRQSTQGKEVGNHTARAVRNFIIASPNLRTKIDWVVAVDGVGVEIAQQQV